MLALPAHDVILDAEAISDVDTTGAAALRQVVEKLQAQGRTFAVARATSDIRDLMAHYGLDLSYFDSNEAAVEVRRSGE